MNYENWLTEELAKLLDVPVEKISVNVPFSEMGVDSMIAVQMSGLIADCLDIFVEPTVVYDYSNIQKLAEFLKEASKKAAIGQS